MNLNRSLAPVQILRNCAGAFAFLTLFACDNAPFVGDKKDRTLELANDTIDVPQGSDLHDVAVTTNAERKDFEPPQVQAKPGDFLRFTTGDSRTHAIVFEVADAGIRSFLESSGQLRSPPLVTNGASWVIALKGAPPGTYNFRCLMHSDSGQLIVATK